VFTRISNCPKPAINPITPRLPTLEFVLTEHDKICLWDPYNDANVNLAVWKQKLRVLNADSSKAYDAYMLLKSQLEIQISLNRASIPPVVPVYSRSKPVISPKYQIF